MATTLSAVILKPLALGIYSSPKAPSNLNAKNHSKNKHSQRLLCFLYTLYIVILGLAYTHSLPTWAESNTDFANLRFKTLRQPDLALIGPQLSAIQDPQGFMWFGGESGLARFDGYDVKLYMNKADDPNSLSDNYIADLLIDHLGQLWIATESGLNRYQHSTDSFTHITHDPNKPNSLSDDHINSMALSKDGYLWLATENGGLNRLNIDTGEINHFFHDAKDENSLSENSHTALFFDHKDQLWIGGSKGSIDRFSPKNYQFTRLKPPAKNGSNSSGPYRITAILEDRSNIVWAGSYGSGLIRIENNQLSYFHNKPNDPSSLSSEFIWDMIEDDEGKLWIATDGGGFSIFDTKSERFQRYSGKSSEGSDTPINKARFVYIDNNENLWLGLFPAGVSLMDRYASAFQNYRHRNGDASTLSDSAILALTEDEKGNYWIGTEKGLNYLDHQSTQITRYPSKPSEPSLLGSAPITSLLLDKHNDLWVGTWYAGLYRLDHNSGEFQHYTSKPEDPNSLSNTAIWGLYEDRAGSIWVGTDDGVNHYQRDSDQFIRYQNTPEQPTRVLADTVYTFYEDKFNNFWVGGRFGLALMDREHGNFYHASFGHEAEATIRTGWVWAIIGEEEYKHPNQNHDEHSAHLWLATQGNGAIHASYDPDAPTQMTFKVYQKKHGLADNTVTGIIQAADGDIWFATGNGLSRFDEQHNHFETIDKRQGIAGNLHNRPAYLLSSRGELLFGSTQGLTVFNPEARMNNQQAPPIVLTDFQVFYKSANILSNGHIEASDINTGALETNSDAPSQAPPTTLSITKATDIYLSYRHSVFSLTYAAINFQMTQQNQYAHTLEGFDNAWHHVGSRRTATYTNLDPGDYIFHVKAANNQGVWNDKGASLRIHILPPWWQTIWAYALYSLIFAGILALIFYTRWHKKIVENERLVNKKLRDLDKLKDQFLASTSHELRTPLNGIIGLSESLILGAAGEIPEGAQESLKLIVSSGRRLGSLINDILDFSRLRQHNITLHTQSVNLGAIVNLVLTLSKPLAINKPLTLTNNIPDGFSRVIADEDRLQQILYNLIGNAIKFTPAGKVIISATTEDKVVWVSIQDTGIGIAEHKRQSVFEAFEQVNGADARDHGGTGLGLAVTRQLVELHQGKLELVSEPGMGSTFRFSLTLSDTDQIKNAIEKATPQSQAPDKLNPKPYDASGDLGKNDQHTPKSLSLNAAAPSTKLIIDAFPDTPEPDTSKPDTSKKATKATLFHILVVDDEPVNRKVLHNLLSMKNYRVSECSGGHETLKFLNAEHDVDLVIIDIMMPLMSGYVVCEKLRETYSPGQLPIVFLTAKNQLSDLEAGYAAGGNDFLRKPVAKEELYARLRTHLQLLKINRELEDKVEERTKKLHESNQILSSTHQHLEHSYQHLNQTHLELEQAHNNLQDSHEQLKQTQSQLVQSEKMSGLGTLVAGIGHEINNPTSYTHVAASNLERNLESFKTLLLGMLADESDDVISKLFNERFEKLFANLASVRNGTERIKDIVSDLRTFSRKDYGKMQTTHICSGLKTTLKLVNANYGDQVNFVCDFQADPPIQCIPSELKQVFMNLIVNACQAIISSTNTDKISPVINPTINLAEENTVDESFVATDNNNNNDYNNASDKESKKGTLVIKTLLTKTQQRQDYLTIIFDDNGEGMSEHTREHIFEPFFTTKPEGEGTGLGMSISFGIIERHKGKIEAESKEGIGTTILVHLPVGEDF
ncbi:MAG: hypothetical protein COA42_14775 [Alteromonadaceae bacterium]|nr:MAG: hypothetical protein COA42_14775 [Alteromonadaceae bacterium]